MVHDATWAIWAASSEYLPQTTHSSCLNFTTCFNLNLRRSNSSCQSSSSRGFSGSRFWDEEQQTRPIFCESWQQCPTELKQFFRWSHRNLHLFLPFSHPEPFFEGLKVFEVLRREIVHRECGMVWPVNGIDKSPSLAINRITSLKSLFFAKLLYGSWWTQNSSQKVTSLMAVPVEK